MTEDFNVTDLWPAQQQCDVFNAFLYYFHTYPSRYRMYFDKPYHKLNRDNIANKIYHLIGKPFHQISRFLEQPHTPIQDYTLIYDRFIINIIDDKNITISFDAKKYGYNDFTYLKGEIFSDDNCFTKEEHSRNISFVVQRGSELGIEEIPSRNTNRVDITKNYNDDFLEVDRRIQEYIRQDRNGLVLLHSDPGIGKSSYIRHLLNNIGSKRFVYIPPTLATLISRPDFLSFAITHLQNSVLIIEDAENVIKQRHQSEDNQSVSNLLNLWDGLMSDVLNLQLICTFNCDVAEIDEALKRKGRLLLQYRFEKLSVDKSNKLLEELGSSRRTDEPMSLAEIYNEEDNNSQTEEKQVGFAAHRNNLEMASA